MTLSRNSGSKPQSVEDRIGCGALRLAPDPVLNPGEAFGGLMDIVAVDIRDGIEQLFDTLIPAAGGRECRRMGVASRYQGDRAHSAVLSHPIAFPRGVMTCAEPSSPAPTEDHPLAG
jgi:hypothetical protein